MRQPNEPPTLHPLEDLRCVVLTLRATGVKWRLEATIEDEGTCKVTVWWVAHNASGTGDSFEVAAIGARESLLELLRKLGDEAVKHIADERTELDGIRMAIAMVGG